MARASSDDTPTAATAPVPSKTTLALGLLGALLCYLAQPPLGWGLLAWIGPTPWLLLARAERLPGRRPYLALWLSGAAYWLLAIQWIRLPYWANFLALIGMAIYLGAYLPTFVALTRVAVHRLRLPLWLAGAVVWTGLEWLRAHLLTGFLMASLAHTQAKTPSMIQIADLGGEYAVTFLILLVAGAIAAALPLKCLEATTPSERSRPRRRRVLKLVRTLAPAVIAIVATFFHGASGAFNRSIQRKVIGSFRPPPRVAIIQTNMLSDWKGTPERDAAAMQEQIELSIRTVRGSREPVDLIVWPETMFRQPWFVRDEQHPPADGAVHKSRYAAAFEDLRMLAEETGAALLVGIDRVLVSKARPPAGDDEVEMLVYNAAAAVDRTGKLLGYYAKMHLLPFGEFIPFASWLPGLAHLVPITGNSLWGEGPVAFEIDGVTYAPNICYESALPHLIRRQVNELTAAGTPPDVLVNLTNDSWFWGSSELDMHLACGVFRAVEMRMPLVIAANRGLSAYITDMGRIEAVTQRDRADALVVDVQLPPKNAGLTIYARCGDWLPLACLAACGLFAAVGLGKGRQAERPIA
jgi:apolipoprotein N-acyltransferase